MARGYAAQPAASPAAEGVHDLDPVARPQAVDGAVSARDDLAVDLHVAFTRGLWAGEALGVEQRGQGRPRRAGAVGAAEQDVHAAIFAGLRRSARSRAAIQTVTIS